MKTCESCDNYKERSISRLAWWSGYFNNKRDYPSIIYSKATPEICTIYDAPGADGYDCRINTIKDNTKWNVNYSELRFVGDDVYGENMKLTIDSFEHYDIIKCIRPSGAFSCYCPTMLSTTPNEPARDEKAIKAIKDSLDQRWSKIVKCSNKDEVFDILRNTFCALCKTYSHTNDECPLKEFQCNGTCIKAYNDFINSGDNWKPYIKAMYDLLCQKYKEYSGLDYEPERPEPKFKVGQMTDRGKIIAVIWGEDWATSRSFQKDACDRHKHWHYQADNSLWRDESELTAAPSIEITLFKVVDGKVETISCPILDINGDKDECAEANFKNGYCAILITKDGVSERRYCPEIEALLPEYVVKCWYQYKDKLTPMKRNIEMCIEYIINNPKWTVERSGIKMRAYRMKDGSVDVAFPNHTITFINSWELLKVIGFTPDNIMPSILHGKG